MRELKKTKETNKYEPNSIAEKEDFGMRKTVAKEFQWQLKRDLNAD